MSHMPISVELRLLRIPTRWSVSEDGYLMPEVDQRPSRKLVPILDDPRDLRTEFLKLPHTTKAAVKFLGKIGVWCTWKIMSIKSGSMSIGSSVPEWRLDGAFGYRYLSHLSVQPIRSKDLWKEQAYWKDLLLCDLKPLRSEFAAPPGDGASPAERENFAVGTEFGNTLRMHMDWKSGTGQYPRAIIQPLTGREFLIATAWLDVVQQAKVQVCQRRDCGLPFTGREQKYCSDSCGHLMAVRAFRERQNGAGARRHKKRGTRKSLR
jgi:hypothetical protein